MLNNLCILSIFDNINFTVRNFQPNALLGYHYFIPAVRDRSDQMRGRSPLKIGQVRPISLVFSKEEMGTEVA